MNSGDGPPSQVGVEWLNRKGAWLFYVAILVFSRLLLGAVLQLEPYMAWTVVNVVHAIVTFVAFHWIKGNPFPTFWNPSSDKLTWWEQLDHRKQATPSRKFCVIVVLALFLVTYEATPVRSQTTLVHMINAIVFVVMVIAKLPSMDKVRLFGINK
mmetsp:Transcript_2714/g.4745  ORF Transcript_2714/g.4745 Transcript_2714/m.4745 type:complete len:155 (-) Transcript_2714:470-934(-)